MDGDYYMIITGKFENFGSVRKNVIGKLGTDFLYNQIVRKIKNLVRLNPKSYILTSGCIINKLNNNENSNSYDSLYNTFFSRIDDEELAKLVNGFIDEVEIDYPDIRLLKTYLFAFFIDHWCQMVEMSEEMFQKDSTNISFIGNHKNLEYKLLQILNRKNLQRQREIKCIFSLSASILTLTGNYITRIKQKRETNNLKFLNHYSGQHNSVKPLKGTKTIIISILEERRFSRIDYLYKELVKAGYQVLLYSSLPKKETDTGLEKYQELKSSRISDEVYITRKLAEKLLSQFTINLDKFQSKYKETNILEKHKYKGVPLFEIAWDSISSVVEYRGKQITLNQFSVKRILEEFNVVGFIGMDNSIATATWLEQCKKNKIPTFFYFYNAVKSPVIYRLLYETYSPTAWILGGERQKEHFIEISNKQESQYFVVGDIFADSIVLCDKVKIRKQIRSEINASEDEKIIVLASSYIVADFTRDRKKNLFQSVYEATLKLGVKLIIKAHPNENIILLKEEMKLWNIEAHIFHTENIRDVFLAADMVVMYFSEAAQQAMLLGLPVISIIPEEMVDSFDKHWDYFSSGAVEFVPLGKSPMEAIRNIFFSNGCREQLIERGFTFIKKMLGNSDGKNAERFAHAVNFIIRKSYDS